MATNTKKTPKPKKVAKRGGVRTNSRRRSGDENIRSLTKTGGGRTYTVSLPMATIRAFGWRERQKLTLTIDSKRHTILIKDWKK